MLVQQYKVPSTLLPGYPMFVIIECVISSQGCSKLEAENDDLRLQMEETEKIKCKLEEELEEVKSKHVLLVHHVGNPIISIG